MVYSKRYYTHLEPIFFSFLLFQIGTIYIWSIVYNIVRIYSSKIFNEVKVDDSMISSNSILENDPENISNDRSHNDHVKQFEIECTNSNGHVKVALHHFLYN